LCSCFDNMDEHLHEMIRLPDVKNLFLSSVETDDIPACLGRLKALEFLQLCDNNMSIFNFKKLLSALPNLKMVQVSTKFFDILEKEEKDKIPPERFSKIVAVADFKEINLQVTTLFKNGGKNSKLDLSSYVPVVPEKETSKEQETGDTEQPSTAKRRRVDDAVDAEDPEDMGERPADEPFRVLSATTHLNALEAALSRQHKPPEK